MHRADPPTTVTRKNLDGTESNVPCPPLLPDYQQHLRGVDRGDQLIGYYNIGRRSAKWWKRCFLHVIECSLLNAYVLDGLAHPDLHSIRGSKKRDFLSFRLEVAKDLIGSFRVKKKPGHPRADEYSDLDRLNGKLDHWPVKTTKK